MARRYPDVEVTAPCGCRGRGRFIYSDACTVIDRATWTGSRAMRHSTREIDKMFRALPETKED